MILNAYNMRLILHAMTYNMKLILYATFLILYVIVCNVVLLVLYIIAYNTGIILYITSRIFYVIIYNTSLILYVPSYNMSKYSNSRFSKTDSRHTTRKHSITSAVLLVYWVTWTFYMLFWSSLSFHLQPFPPSIHCKLPPCVPHSSIDIHKLATWMISECLFLDLIVFLPLIFLAT